MASVLDLVKAAAVRLQLPTPSTAIGNADPFTAQILGALFASADELLDRYPVNRLLPDRAWAKAADGTVKPAPTIDTDVVMIDEGLIKSAILWRWRSDNGFDYAEDFRTVEERLSRLGLAYTKTQRGDAIQL
ncbi:MULTISPECIES: hypothetical protein [unclassified Aureimonas]|uniref:hypothetical protein n=1 Tax=unclassified Aureimonas TaxID=2615206 RepID=UPI0006FF6163|nr:MULTISPECIES: hypothetical protein [unclassified Aureimonas]KQT52267.1 hypothetical protein ASG62_16560 [Aureimonas sp. Leaf427]KQT73241.1 hypothetical protein ASG54_17835 [Aureimonas sp. Leaf460]